MSVQIGVEAEFDYETDAGENPSDLFDRLMDELVNLAGTDCGISDPAVSIDLGKGQALIELVASAATFDEAVAVADSCVRSAAHAAGWSTAHWTVAKNSQRAERVDA